MRKQEKSTGQVIGTTFQAIVQQFFNRPPPGNATNHLWVMAHTYYGEVGRYPTGHRHPYAHFEKLCESRHDRWIDKKKAGKIDMKGKNSFYSTAFPEALPEFNQVSPSELRISRTSWVHKVICCVAPSWFRHSLRENSFMAQVLDVRLSWGVSESIFDLSGFHMKLFWPPNMTAEIDYSKIKDCKRAYSWGPKEEGQDGYPNYSPPTIYNIFSGAVTTVKGAFENAKNTVTGAFDNIGEGIQSYFWWVKYIIPAIILVAVVAIVGVLHRLGLLPLARLIVARILKGLYITFKFCLITLFKLLFLCLKPMTKAVSGQSKRKQDKHKRSASVANRKAERNALQNDNLLTGNRGGN